MKMVEPTEISQPVVGNSTLPYLLLLLLNLTQTSKLQKDLVEENLDLEDMERQLNRLVLLKDEKDVFRKNDLLIDAITGLQVMLANMILINTKLIDTVTSLDTKLYAIINDLYDREEDLANCSKRYDKLILEHDKPKASCISSEENLKKKLNGAANQINELQKNSSSMMAKHKECNETIANLEEKLSKSTQDNIELKEKLKDWKYKYENLTSTVEKQSEDIRILVGKMDSKANRTEKELRRRIDFYNELLDMSPSQRGEKLLKAATKGDLTTVRLLLMLKTNLTHRDSDGRNALSIAVLNEDEDMTIMLTDAGSDIESKNNRNNTPLCIASLKGFNNLALYLTNKGANLNTPCAIGRTALQAAVEKGHLNIVQMLIQRGADINIKDDAGSNALHLAANFNQEDVGNFLVDAGSDIDRKNPINLTPLCRASLNGLKNLTRHLIDKGAKLDIPCQYGRTALQWAISGGHLSIVKLLVKRGADVNHKDDYGKTTLEIAKSYGKKNVVDWMVKNNIK